MAKAAAAGNARVIVTERGTSFGYHNLVVDMRAFPMMRALGVPVVFDVTHSLQLPGGGDGVTAGQAEYIEPLASAGVAAGVDGVFLEVHENPSRARSDAQNARAARSRSASVALMPPIVLISTGKNALMNTMKTFDHIPMPNQIRISGMSATRGVA